MEDDRPDVNPWGAIAGGFLYDGGMNERNRSPEELVRAAGASPVVEAARKALADIEPRDTPAPLRKVSVSTQPSLPLPLERRLLREIEDNEWFRERAAEQFEGSAAASEPEERAGALFLFRPEGWKADLAETARSVEAARQAGLIKEMTGQIEKLESELEKWRTTAKRYRKTASAAENETGRLVAKARSEAFEKARSRFGGDLAEQKRENRRLEEELAAAAEELDQQRERLSFTREALDKVRRSQPPPPPDPGPNAWADREPIESARFLDEVVEAHFPSSTFREPKPERAVIPLALPPGVSPSAPPAVECLLALDRPFSLLVDGYNVGFHIDNHRFHPPVIRNRLETYLTLFKNLARGWPRVTVVYDSSCSGDTTVDYLGGEIEVMFTSAGRSADDELVSMAAEQGESAVVVSSDKEIQKKAGESGSLVLYSEALAGWILGR